MSININNITRNLGHQDVKRTPKPEAGRIDVYWQITDGLTGGKTIAMANITQSELEVYRKKAAKGVNEQKTFLGTLDDVNKLIASDKQANPTPKPAQVANK